MSLEINSTKKPDDRNGKPMIPIPKEEIVTQFIDSIVVNLQCLGEEADPNILLLPGFCRLHKVIQLEFECSHCQEAVTQVLTQIMQFKRDQPPNEIQEENSSSTCISEAMEKDEEENEDVVKVEEGEDEGEVNSGEDNES